MKQALILLLLVLSLSQAKAQLNRNKQWLVGIYGVVANFKASGIEADTSIMTTHPSYTGLLTPFYICKSSICDTNGNLLLLCDGLNILNRQGHVLDGGDSLLPLQYSNLIQWYGPGFAQFSIILPMEHEIYYVFTPASSDSMVNVINQTGYGSYDLMYSHKVDMKLNGGAGKVVAPKRLVAKNLNQSLTQMMACRHANGKDWWLLRMGADTLQVYSYLVTQDSVYYKGTQKLPHQLYIRYDNRGQSTFSNDGTRYASVQNFNKNTLILADFDRCTGILSNSQQLTLPLVPTWAGAPDSSLTGVCFSPNDSFLYVTRSTHIYQYHFATQSWFTVHGPDTVDNEFTGYNTIYRGNDDKLYIGNWHGIAKQFSVIDNPNGQGQSCNFCRKCFRNYAKDGWLQSPTTAPNYRLGAEPCWPLSSEGMGVVEPVLKVYPNPAANKFQIQNAKYQSIKELYNSVGQLVLRTKENEIDVSHLGRGIYFLHCSSQVVKVVVE